MIGVMWREIAIDHSNYLLEEARHSKALGITLWAIHVWF